MPQRLHAWWPKSLTVFGSAMREAIGKYGTSLEVEDHKRPVLALDVQEVKRAFATLQVADGNTAKERNDRREKVFHQACHNAQQRNLIGAIERNDTQCLWLRSPERYAE